MVHAYVRLPRVCDRATTVQIIGAVNVQGGVDVHVHGVDVKVNVLD
jgi:hypothetical protein